MSVIYRLVILAYCVGAQIFRWIPLNALEYRGFTVTPRLSTGPIHELTDHSGYYGHIRDITDGTL